MSSFYSLAELSGSEYGTSHAPAPTPFLLGSVLRNKSHLFLQDELALARSERYSYNLVCVACFKPRENGNNLLRECSRMGIRLEDEGFAFIECFLPVLNYDEIYGNMLERCFNNGSSTRTTTTRF